ncbi:MAG: hypothetical protein ABIF85_06935 [Nanoarchaeota archaeon]|nr:hypothetical protein [Nanoarchaeota archaeon]MBU4299853.1 hypothetical protein [Nanoarchaeota archaeon]MBU4451676.1 hypothetical protein [Nanoarchaeota archaeon]MCG2723619.1 hypothetical protein [archaeon]
MVVSLEFALTNLYQSIVVGFPALVYAVIVLVIGYIIGRVVGAVVEKMLIRVNLDKYVTEHEHIALNLSAIFSIIAKWWIYFVTIQAVADILEIPVLISIVDSIINFIPGVIGATLVLLVSYGAAIYAKEQILGSKELYSSIVGKILFFLIVYVGISTSLNILKVDTFLIDNILLLIVGAVSLGLAIALGFGLKNVVEETARDYSRAKKTTKNSKR